MRKSLSVLTVVALAILFLSAPVLAFGSGFGASDSESCIQDELSEEQSAAFLEIMEEFRSKMEAVRDEMIAFRDSGDYEAFREKHAERFEIKAERNEKLGVLIPEYADHFENRGGMRNHGGEKSSGHFEGQKGGNQQQ